MNTLKNEHSHLPETPGEVAQEKQPSQQDWELCQQAVEALNQSNQQLRQFASHLMRARDEERLHLANHIHDTIGQNLLALRIDVSMLHARTQETHPRINSKAAVMLNHLDVILANIRGIINRLHPPVLNLGLLATIEWKVREFEQQQQIPCRLQIDGKDGEFAIYDHRALPIMRILHESLTNIARHAEANHVEIDLFGSQHKLIMKVADDGIGIRPDNLNKAGAYGLLWIRERVGAMGGEFAIGANGQRAGTLLMVSIPQ